MDLDTRLWIAGIFIIGAAILSILIMAHGKPDFDITNAQTTTYQVTDLGELAARLGSIDTFDRRGDIIWLDDFEIAPLKWQVSGTGIGNTQARDATSAHNGGWCCMLITGNAAGNTASMYKILPIYDDQRVGFEASIETSTDLRTIDMPMVWYDGTTKMQGTVRIDVVNSKLQLYNSAGAYVDVATGIYLVPATACYHMIKGVVDYKTGKYVRIMVDGITYDVSAYSLRTTAVAMGPYLRLDVIVTNNAVFNRGINVDDVIVTINEP